MTKLVYGVGYNDRKYPAKIGKEKTKAYSHWQKMLMRCYDCSASFNPTYLDCEVSDNFKNYSYFYEWCQNQIGFGMDDYHLDKDLLVKGNKTYNEEYCVFVPRAINNLLLGCKSRRGEFPQGVSFSKKHGMFECYIAREGKRKHLGLYSDPLVAFNVYKQTKEEHLKYMAEKYKDHIDNRVYLALMSKIVDITD